MAGNELRQGEQDMGVEGIGASVVRKEDRRFITGKGRYVDDVKLVGMSYAHFIRSPHAHAKVKSIDSSAATSMPGVLAVLTGQQIVDDKVGNLICGWGITSKDGSPMKMGAWPAMAPETVRFVGQAVAVVIAESKKSGARRRRSRGGRIRGAAGGRRRSLSDQAGRTATAPGSAGQRRLRLGAGRRGRRERGLRQGHQCGDAGTHQQPVGAERDGAARGRSPTMTRPKSTTRCTRPRRIRMSRVSCCRPSTTSRPSTSCASSRQMSAAALARRSTIYPEEMVALWASKKVGPSREMDRRPFGSLPHRRPWPRPCLEGGNGV